MINDVPLSGDSRKIDGGRVYAVLQRPDLTSAVENIFPKVRLTVVVEVGSLGDMPAG
jgi:hypothetical protein